MFEDNFLSEITYITPKKDTSGDILFATYYHLGDNYNVYAMENDLPEIMTHKDTVKYIEKLNKETKQDWFIPKLDILKKLYEMKDVGDFKDTFVTKYSRGNSTDRARWYWSSTEHRGDSDYVYVVGFTDGGVGWSHKGSYRLSSRPCRAELVI
jgi:hypothetical protein